MRRSPSALLFVSSLSICVICILLFSTSGFAAQPNRVTAPIVATQTMRLAAGVPMQARPEFDQGAVDPSLKMNMTLLTVPSASQQRALTKLLADQQNPSSASYHKWLTPQQYADRFGLSLNDVATLTTWLQSQGFTVADTAMGRNWIVFTGTAAQVERSFQTPIHNFKVNGETHFANTTSPSIPTALSGVVVGIRGLNDFLAKSNAHRTQPGYTLTVGSKSFLFVAPGDIASIYDINTLLGSGTDGTGQTLAVIGETDVYLDDLNNFRSGFNINAVSGCTTNSNGVITSCSGGNFRYVFAEATGTDPGTPNSLQDDLGEADIDLEWSNAVARKATIAYVNAPLTGVFTALYYAIDHKIAPVITMSYTTPCELADGNILADETELQKANSFGITFMNSSGDTGAAECDFGNNLAVFGYAVAYPASSPEVTGVGGTLIPAIDPNEYNSTYWNSSNDTNGDGGSAKGYIPEQVWNDAEEFGLRCTPSSPCTLRGSTVTDWVSAQAAIGISGGGGGVSNCFTTDANGVCTGGFPRPSWQAGISASAINPSGAGETSTPARYSPDVSLLASANFPGYIVCTAQSELGGTGNTSVCSGGAAGITNMLTACVNRTGPCSIFGGTSISSPVFAGIVTLLNQYVVAQGVQSTPGLGNINPMLYSLAAANSTNQAFNSVTTPNTGAYSDGAWCQAGTPTSGVSGDPWPVALQCPSSGFLGFDAFNSDSTTGYNLVTGLGSVNVGNLFAAWVAASVAPDFSLSVSPSTLSITPGLAGGTRTITVTDQGGFAGSVSLVASGLPTGVTASFNPTSTTTTSILTLTASALAPAGTATVTITGTSGSLTHTTTIALTVTPPPNFTLSANSSNVSLNQGTNRTSAITVVPTNGFAGSVTLAASGLPSGVTAGFSPNPTTTTSTLTLTASNSATPGTATVTITGTSGSLTPQTTTIALTVNQNFALTTPSVPLPTPVAAGLSATSTFNVTSADGKTFASAVTFACNETPVDPTVSCAFTSVAQGAKSPQTVTLTIKTTGPNTIAVRAQRQRADNRSPWLPLALPLAGIVMVGLVGRKMSRCSAIAGLCVSLVLLGLLLACGSSNTPPAVGISVSPSGATVFPSGPTGGTWPPQTATFTATVTNNTNTAVNWSVSPATAGSITSGGVYTAPTIAAGLPGSATITATSQADSTKTASATVTITPTTVPGSYPITVTATEGPTANTTSAFTLTVH